MGLIYRIVVREATGGLVEGGELPVSPGLHFVFICAIMQYGTCE